MLRDVVEAADRGLKPSRLVAACPAGMLRDGAKATDHRALHIGASWRRCGCPRGVLREWQLAPPSQNGGRQGCYAKAASANGARYSRW
jgi:hypothetical protein